MGHRFQVSLDLVEPDLTGKPNLRRFRWVNTKFALNNPYVVDFAINNGIFLAMVCGVLYHLRRSPAISVLPMRHRPRPPEQDDLYQPSENLLMLQRRR